VIAERSRGASRLGRVAGTAAVLAALAAAPPAAAQTAAQLKREVASLAVEERLGAVVPGDAPFVDVEGRPVTLRALAGGPVLLSFNYVACTRLCGLQIAGIARALRDLRWDGEGFSVVTVSIDPDEQRDAVTRAKEAAVHTAGGGAGVARSWRFVRGAPGEVEALARAVGFKYRRDPGTGTIAHPATLVVLTSDGRVSGYLHGIHYEPDALRSALERAGSGRVASAAEQATFGGFLLTCIGLDPADPAPLAIRIMRAGGAAVVVFLAGFLSFHALRGARRRRSEVAP